jgi:hypothetical protein
MVWNNDAVSAADEDLDIAPNCQCTVDLESNGAGSSNKVVVPVSKGGCVHQRVSIVPIQEPSKRVRARGCAMILIPLGG